MGSPRIMLTGMHVCVEHLPGTTAKVTLQLAVAIRLDEVQMKNPDVSLEMLKRYKTPSSAAERQK